MKIFHLAALTAAAALLLATTTDAGAQDARNCALRGVVMTRLADGYGETHRSMWLSSNKAMVEVFASAITGSWTITVTAPGGPTCLVASGQRFDMLAGTLPVRWDDV